MIELVCFQAHFVCLNGNDWERASDRDATDRSACAEAASSGFPARRSSFAERRTSASGVARAYLGQFRQTQPGTTHLTCTAKPYQRFERGTLRSLLSGHRIPEDVRPSHGARVRAHQPQKINNMATLQIVENPRDIPSKQRAGVMEKARSSLIRSNDARTRLVAANKARRWTSCAPAGKTACRPLRPGAGGRRTEGAWHAAGRGLK